MTKENLVRERANFKKKGLCRLYHVQAFVFHLFHFICLPCTHQRGRQGRATVTAHNVKGRNGRPGVALHDIHNGLGKGIVGRVVFLQDPPRVPRHITGPGGGRLVQHLGAQGFGPSSYGGRGRPGGNTGQVATQDGQERVELGQTSGQT